jgi:pimeloyl-ACP methyl ester carboxylesterase
VLLIHGLGGTRRTWRPLIPALATTFTVIAPELPCHGDSDPPAGDYSPGAHACAVRDLLVALGHSPASILGHSLGGGGALRFAYQFPDRTDRLMLISSGALGAEVTPMLRAATLPGAGAMVAGLSKVPVALTQQLFRVLPALTSHADARPLAEGLRGLTGGRQRRAFVRTAHTVLDWRGRTVSASRQTGLLSDIPVLLAWGAEDKTIPARHHHVCVIASDGDLIPTARSRPANAGEPIAWAVDLPVITSARRQSRAPFGLAGYLSDLESQANTS